MSKKIKVVSDYILIRPDKPKGGAFDVGENYIDETGTVVDVGPNATEAKAWVGKRVIFNAWTCDKKTVDKESYYFAPASANAVCALV